MRPPLWRSASARNEAASSTRLGHGSHEWTRSSGTFSQAPAQVPDLVNIGVCLGCAPAAERRPGEDNEATSKNAEWPISAEATNRQAALVQSGHHGDLTNLRSTVDRTAIDEPVLVMFTEIRTQPINTTAEALECPLNQSEARPQDRFASLVARERSRLAVRRRRGATLRFQK